MHRLINARGGMQKHTSSHAYKMYTFPFASFAMSPRKVGVKSGARVEMEVGGCGSSIF